MKLLLQHRILLGYIILIAVIGSMAAIMFHERNRVQNIESETTEIREANRTINAAHRHITVLATLGESAIAWDEEDYRKYQVRRLRIDSLLQILQRDYEEFVPTQQIDTLRFLLVNKEKHLHQAMQIFQQHDSLLSNKLPAITQQAKSSHTVIRRKKGIAGIFGGKETVQVPTSSKILRSLNNQLISMEEERQQTINTYTDSLRVQNRELNRKLYMLIQDMDEQTQTAFQDKELYLQKSHNRSVMIISGLVVSAILLLTISYLKIHRDIKEKADNKKALEEHVEKLRRSVKANEELISNRHRIMQTITHELRTPLSVIIGYADMAVDETDTTISQDYARKALLTSHRMISMLNTMLGYFRLDSGKEQINSVPFSLRGVSDTLQAEFTPLAGNKGLKLSVESEKDEVLFGDRERLMQVGDNLLSNAVKFTETGSVTLKMHYGNGKLYLIVEDTGSGMSSEEQARIFNAFEQLPNAASQDGFGLGLSIVQRIVNMLRGTVAVESIKGKGTRFTVVLPMSTADNIPEQIAKTMPVYYSETSFSVIALDDNESLLSMMKEMFARNGVRCDTVSNVSDLMEYIRNRDYDLLITDLKMPETSGYEVLELLRSSNVGKSKDMPVIVATASTGYGKRELTGMGFSGVLLKPFSMQELMETCTSCVTARMGTIKPDFSTLLSCGNEPVLLDKLIEATEEEMEAVKDAAEQKDTEALRRWIHHLRSSWMVLRTEAPLHKLQALLAESVPEEEKIHEAVMEILETGDNIIRLANEERRKYNGHDNRG